MSTQNNVSAFPPMAKVLNDNLTAVGKALREQGGWGFNIQPNQDSECRVMFRQANGSFRLAAIPSGLNKGVEISKRYQGKPAVYSNEGTGEFWTVLPKFTDTENHLQAAMLKPFDVSGRQYMPGRFARFLRGLYRSL